VVLLSSISLSHFFSLSLKNKNSLSAKSDGFFVNIDYSILDPKESLNIIEILESIKNELAKNEHSDHDDDQDCLDEEYLLLEK